MESTYKLLKSRTFWTVVIMALVPIVKTIEPTLPVVGQNVVEVILAGLAIYFHNDTAQKAGAIN